MKRIYSSWFGSLWLKKLSYQENHLTSTQVPIFYEAKNCMHQYQMESKAQHNIFLCMILSWQRHQDNVQLCVDLILQSLHARTSKETWCHASAKDMRAVLPTHRLPTKLGFFEFTCHGSKNCWAGDLKFGYFSSVCPQKLFFFKFVNFLSIQSAFEPFQWPRTFLSISRIKTSWRPITIDFPLHAEVNDPNVFCPIESFWKLGVWLLDKNWTTLISQQKSQFAVVWCSWVLTTLYVSAVISLPAWDNTENSISSRILFPF